MVETPPSLDENLVIFNIEKACQFRNKFDCVEGVRGCIVQGHKSSAKYLRLIQ